MRFNKAQRQMLVLLGMAVAATDAEAVHFFNTLKADQQAQILAVKDDAATAPASTTGATAPAATAPASASITPEQVRQIGTEAANAALAAREAAAAARRNEVSTIARLAGLPESWVSEQTQTTATIEQVREAAIAAREAALSPISGVRVGDTLALSSIGPAMSDAILQRAGIPLYEDAPDGADDPVAFNDYCRARALARSAGSPMATRKPHDRAREFRNMSLFEMTRNYLENVGIRTAGMSRAKMAQLVFNRQEMNRRAGNIFMAHSTSDFDYILADVLGKSLRARYFEFAPNWSVWARAATAPDFKPVKRDQLGGVDTPPVVPEGGEYTMVTVSDAKEQYYLKKYGHIFSITWEALVNDDLDAFARIPAAQGLACARLEDDLAYGRITANPNMSDGAALFIDATHRNYTSSGTALSVDSLGVGKAKMRNQRGINSSEILDIAPAFLLVPVGKETLARQLISSTVDPSKNNATPNPFTGDLTVVANPRLDANSTTAWYLAANTAQIDTIEVLFLEGERAPQLSQEDGFSMDGRQYKCRHTVAAAPIDWRGLYKNAGA